MIKIEKTTTGKPKSIRSWNGQELNSSSFGEGNTRLLFGEYMSRSWRDTDVEPLQRYANNRKIWLNLRDVFPHPYTIDDARWWVEHASQDDPERSFAIASAEEPIGAIGLIFGEDVHRFSAELGYWFAEPFWGRGIMTGAVRALIEYAFRKLPLNRIYVEPFAHNLASVRVLEKAGFLREGVLKANVVKDNAILDQIVYAKLAKAHT
jgi:ribosomal-protein-alanine N-acetyltransferase